MGLESGIRLSHPANHNEGDDRKGRTRAGGGMCTVTTEYSTVYTRIIYRLSSINIQEAQDSFSPSAVSFLRGEVAATR